MTMREDEISAMGNPFAWLRRAGRSATVQCSSLYLSGAKKGSLAAALHVCNMSVRGQAAWGRAVWRASISCWVDFRTQPNTLSGQAVPAVSRTPPTADSKLKTGGIPHYSVGDTAPRRMPRAAPLSDHRDLSWDGPSTAAYSVG